MFHGIRLPRCVCFLVARAFPCGCCSSKSKIAKPIFERSSKIACQTPFPFVDDAKVRTKKDPRKDFGGDREHKTEVCSFLRKSLLAFL